MIKLHLFGVCSNSNLKTRKCSGSNKIAASFRNCFDSLQVKLLSKMWDLKRQLCKLCSNLNGSIIFLRFKTNFSLPIKCGINDENDSIFFASFCCSHFQPHFLIKKIAKKSLNSLYPRKAQNIFFTFWKFKLFFLKFLKLWKNLKILYIDTITSSESGIFFG